MGKLPGRKADYYKIKRTLYSYVLIAVATAITLVVFSRQLMRGVLGELIVSFLIKSFYLERQDALTIYQYTIRNNMDIIIFVAVALCFLLLCRAILSSFMRYFEEVNAGIDMLINDDCRPIGLSAEIDFIEQKLNTLRRTLEKREMDAKMAEQRKNDLVIYLAHDVKTPLTSVIGYLSLLDEAVDMPNEQKRKYVRTALKKAHRLERLIDEFFEITRYNIGAIALTKESIDLAFMLSQMTEEFYPQLSTNGKRAAIHLTEGLKIYCDPDKLARVFNNILRNAIAYSSDNSIIDISAKAHANTVSISFTSDGGIAKDKLESIFDKFYRLDCARSSDTGGAGLGLAVAREIVLLHGGRIYADSDGNQTTFTVEIPDRPEQS